MSRGMPYSLAVHAMGLLMIFFLGSEVSRAPLEVPRSIRVRLVEMPRVSQQENQPVAQATPQPQPQEKVLPPKELPKPKQEVRKEPVKVEPETVIKPQETPAREVAETEINEESALAAPSGPSVSGTDVDFPFAYYLGLVEGQISRRWNPRQLGFRDKTVVSCVVHFNIARNGLIGQINLTRSSGIDLFDREALRAVQSTRKLPPLPNQYHASSLGISFVFNLEPGH